MARLMVVELELWLDLRTGVSMVALLVFHKVDE